VQRWSRGLNPSISKSPWSAEEDAKLLTLVTKLGTKSWTRIASDLGKRCDVQCRYRFKQLTAVKPRTDNDAPRLLLPPIESILALSGVVPPEVAAEVPAWRGQCRHITYPTPILPGVSI
jgi:hypothetical protein